MKFNLDITSKLDALGKIYRVYDDIAAGFEKACTLGCSDCCTQNVALTTLEGYLLFSFLESSPVPGRPDLRGLLGARKSEKRFRPLISTNALADLCARGEDPPPEENDPTVEKCPLLIEDQCLVYPARPFGCRCFVSQKKCRETGCAKVDPFVLSVNTLVLQFIEHVDALGKSGNLIDVLEFFASEGNRKLYRSGNLPTDSGLLVSNRPVKILMIPPEHRVGIRPILNRLHTIRESGARIQN